ncbi:hypothetical protein PU629_14200 [Pullulanibacillus sp. KACC 23026]|uniref:hypothetical protein n=1 Tax=Pullulanibacillus sp. KACC 23026 TaxID=3028315 RepID=UPI0023B0FE2B|nr:hypothetical protein [Pullulanibacillus sp. KACC 23026]WEG11312.1 hypothetical protein PU629_14200 [Pullulanibacillus sp. KACC 23026]
MAKQRICWLVSGGLLGLYLGGCWLSTFYINWVEKFNEKGAPLFIRLGSSSFQSLWSGLNHIGDFSFSLLISCVMGIVLAFFKRGITGLFLVLGVIVSRLIHDLFWNLFAEPDVPIFHGQVSIGVWPSEEMMITVVFYGFLMGLLVYFLWINKNWMVVIWASIGLLVFYILQGFALLLLGEDSILQILSGAILGWIQLGVWFGLLGWLGRGKWR